MLLSNFGVNFLHKLETTDEVTGISIITDFNPERKKKKN